MLKVIDSTGSSTRITIHNFGAERYDDDVAMMELRLEHDARSGLQLMMEMKTQQFEPEGRQGLLPIIAVNQSAVSQLRVAHQLLEASLVGSGPSPLQIDDYLQVFSGSCGGQLAVEIQPLGWSVRSALHYKGLLAVVFAPVDFAYDEFLTVALGLQSRLTDNAPFKAGFIHRPLQQPMLLLLGLI